MSGVMTVATKKSKSSGIAEQRATDSVRYDLARLLAFAFCSADALIETDIDGTIVFASGATRNLFGHGPESMTGKKFVSFCTKEDRAMCGMLVDRVASGQRFKDIPCNFTRPDKSDNVVSLCGYTVPDLENHCFITGRTVETGRDIAHGGERNAASGLLTMKSFGDSVKAHLQRAAATDTETELSFFSLTGMPELAGRLGDEKYEGLQRRLGLLLKSVSQDGDTAGQIGQDRFGLLHDPDLDLATVEEQISQFARDSDPTGVGVAVQTRSVDVASLDLSKKDMAQAVVYSIQQVASAAADVDLSEVLSDDLNGEIRRAAGQISQVKTVIARGQFDVAYQAIVSLEDRQPHHFEALVRVNSDLVTMNPFEFVCFSEEVGLIAPFDLSMCRKVINRLQSVSAGRKMLPVAVNVSGRSIDSDAFIKNLHALLQDNPEVHGSLMFEITETARISDLDRANAAIRALRADGFHVCLDDFGSGESAFEYLRALEVDFVKIDGKYVKDAVNNVKDRAFLVAMTTLCRDLGIATIAEFIENEETLGFLKECGVAFGQGYLFHKPDTTVDLSGATFRARKNLKRKGTVTSWG